MTPKQEMIIDFLIHLITGIRNNEIQWDDDYVHQSIRHYPEFTFEGVKTWQKINYYRTCHKISHRAAVLLENPNATYNEFQYEHIEPVRRTKDRLLSLIDNNNFVSNDIITIMADCEVIILSKQEGKVLDGSTLKMYELDNNLINGLGMRTRYSKTERLEALETIGFQFHLESLNNALENG